MPGSGMQALMITETNPSMHNWKVGEVKRPAVKNGHVIVRVKATAINPADWKYATPEMRDRVSKFPAVVGSDVAGVIEEVGEGVNQWKKGDEVFGFCGLGTGSGSFAELCDVPASQLAKKPEQFSFAQSATLGSAALTACIGLFEVLGLDMKKKSGDEVGESILIWGANHAVGEYAVQLAAQAGYRVIAEVRGKNFEHFKELGARWVINGNADNIMDELEDIVNVKNPLRLAFDTTGDAGITRCAEAILRSQGKDSNIKEGEEKEVSDDEADKAENGMIFSSVGKPRVTDMGGITVKRTSLDYRIEGGEETLGKYMNHLEKLISDGRLQPNRVSNMPGFRGLEQAVLDCFSGKVSSEERPVATFED